LWRGEDSFQYAPTDGQRFVGNCEAVLALGAWVKITDLHPSLNLHALVNQAAQDAAEGRYHGLIANFSD
jgi:hypothetical protein